MNKTKLRHCPFCGGKDIVLFSAGSAHHRYICSSCGAAGGFRRKVSVAAETWNTRSETDQIQCLLAIREAIGDPAGKLMQDEVVKRVREMADHFRAATKKKKRREAAKGGEK